MLGLLFDPEHEEMQRVLEETRDGRLPRMRKMIEKMRAEGMDISMECGIHLIMDIHGIKVLEK